MKFSKTLIVSPDQKIKLKKFSPAETFGFVKDEALKRLDENHARLFSAQELLYANKSKSLLIVLQGMDTSGKDGVIRHVMRGVNPQGCAVTSFKEPATEELRHDFLWRIHKSAPAKGDIGIFNRSHYEDVLIVRVNELVEENVWRKRFQQINHFEKMLSQNGTVILKFFLHISEEEQRNRLEDRLKDPAKNWKFSESDLLVRKQWKDYREAYEDVLSLCSTDDAPWFIIPSDKKWFRNLAISEIINETFEGLHLKPPKPLANLKKIKIPGSS